MSVFIVKEKRRIVPPDWQVGRLALRLVSFVFAVAVVPVTILSGCDGGSGGDGVAVEVKHRLPWLRNPRSARHKGQDSFCRWI